MKFIQRLRRRRWLWNVSRRAKNSIKKAFRNDRIRLNIGSGNNHYSGWINLDLPYFDVTTAISWEKYLNSYKFHAILMEHVLEHLTENDIRTALSLAKKYMAPDGTIRIAVPDSYHPNPEYINHVKPNGIGPGADDHKTFWNIDTFTDLAKDLGFLVEAKEYYNHKGELVMNNLDEVLGPITRTARKPRKTGITDYSSLIVDLRLGKE